MDVKFEKVEEVINGTYKGMNAVVVGTAEHLKKCKNCI